MQTLCFKFHMYYADNIFITYIIYYIVIVGSQTVKAMIMLHLDQNTNICWIFVL